MTVANHQGSQSASSSQGRASSASSGAARSSLSSLLASGRLKAVAAGVTAIVAAVSSVPAGQVNQANTAGGPAALPSTAQRAANSAAITNATTAALVKTATPATPTRNLALGVVASRDSLAANGPKSGTAVAHYKWLIQQDNTGNPEGGQDDPRCHPSTNANFPTGCPWPSIVPIGSSPVISEGTDADWTTGITLPAYNPSTGRGIKDGKYLVSVTADGYELGGSHFTVPAAANTVGGNVATVPVKLNPFPIPLGTIRMRVCQDQTPVSGTCEIDTEKPLAGFHAMLTDATGLVSTDNYGNPLCTQYRKNAQGLFVLDQHGRPDPLPNTGGECVSGADGIITIPNMPQNHYTARAIPPTGQTWIQTTTLEGYHDFDVWLQSNDTGYDTELVAGGEPVPFVEFGFVSPTGAQPTGNSGTGTATTAAGIGTGHVKGQVYGALGYFGGVGGLPGNGLTAGLSGLKLDHPMKQAWVALNGLSNNDNIIYGGPANPVDGTFDITNVPDGSYSLSAWDFNQDYLLDNFNVTVSHGQVADLGILPLSMWWTRIDGKVCIDNNGNGRCDAGEPGLPRQLVQNLTRNNNAVDGGINTAKTDVNGHYELTQGYPVGQFVVEQVFNTRYKTTGITYQACNDPQQHTSLTPAVDISYLATFGLCGHIDWALKPYTPATGDNGGIVATVIYDTTNTSYLGSQVVQLNHMVGVPGVQTDLFTPLKDANGEYVRCTTANGCAANDGSYAVQSGGSLVSIDQMQAGNSTQPVPHRPGVNPTPDQSYVSEHYGPPTGCVPLDANGKVLGTDQQDIAAVPGQAAYQNGGAQCIEAAINAVNTGSGTDNNPICYTDAAGNPVPADVAAPLEDPQNPNPGYKICADGNGNPVLHGTQTVDGNYALAPPGRGDYLIHLEIPGDKVLPPTTDTNGTAVDRPLYKITTEQDRNDTHGLQLIPQGGDTSTVDWMNTPDPSAQQPTGPLPENSGAKSNAPDTQCVGPQFTVHVTDGNFLADGGSPLEGSQQQLCDTRLVHLNAGQSVAPNFHVHTDVPIATKFSGLLLDDAAIDVNHKSANLGDVNAIGGAPIGVYDWAQNLMTTTTTDYNGVYQVLMPSTQINNCQNPAGVCPTIYRFVGNDPGQPSSPNYNYNPQYRTIAANFQAWPGQIVPADNAPTSQTYTTSTPGQLFSTPAAAICLPPYSTDAVKAAQNVPQLFSIDKPFTTTHGTRTDTVTISGLGFGDAQGNGSVTLTSQTGTSRVLATTAWNDRSITVTIPAINSLGSGAYQLDVINNGGNKSRSGITYQVLRGAADYHPALLLVGSGPTPPTSGPDAYAFTTYTTIQSALDAAATKGNSVVVVYPNNGGQVTVPSYTSSASTQYTATSVTDSAAQWNDNAFSGFLVQAGGSTATVLSNGGNTITLNGGWTGGTPARNTPFQLHQVQAPGSFQPLTAYFENIVVHSAVKLQGTGPGGVYPADPVSGLSTAVAGSVIDGRYFFTGEIPAGSTGTVQSNWENLVAATPHGGPAIVPDAAVVTVLGNRNQYRANFAPSIDGFRIQGGNDNAVGGNQGNLFYGKVPATSQTYETQGGAIYLHAFADNFRITNNVVASDSGVYGDIRVGAPQGTPAGIPANSTAPNHNVVVANNQVIATGGTNLAGALGLFAGSDGYSVQNNFFCGNHSSEYGGAISHFGLSPNGTISDNVIALNESMDEGGGIMVAGETPPAGQLSRGAGSVTIIRNRIAGNLSGDDGGGIRFLTAGLASFLVSDNQITDNISTHEGGGISIDNAPNVTIVNNTIAKNITTATAASSNGAPAPAGISTGLNSTVLDKANSKNCPTITSKANPKDCVSIPTLLNNILWDNRAGSWSPVQGVLGIGLRGTADINVWDLGTADGSASLAPHSSLIGSPAAGAQGYTNDGSNVIGTDPRFVAPYDIRVTVQAQRTFFRFRPAATVLVDLPDNLIGTYSLAAGSAAIGSGAAQYPATGNPLVRAPLTNINNAPWLNGNRDRGAF